MLRGREPAAGHDIVENLVNAFSGTPQIVYKSFHGLSFFAVAVTQPHGTSMQLRRINGKHMGLLLFYHLKFMLDVSEKPVTFQEDSGLVRGELYDESIGFMLSTQHGNLMKMP